MSDTKSKFTAEQASLVNQFVEAYGIKAEECKFFTDDPEPFLKYDAACVVLDRLVPQLAAIKPSVVEAPLPDSICTEVELTFADGKRRYGLGIANINEKNEDNEAFSDQQLVNLSLSRGLRQAMRSAAINLVRLHHGGKIAEFSGGSNRDHLLRQVHALAEECGYIDQHGKALWQRFLRNRYGVESSAKLSDILLADLAAALKTIVPVDQKLAA